MIIWSSLSLMTLKSISSFNFDLSLELQPLVTNCPPWECPTELQNKYIPRKQPLFPLSKPTHLPKISDWQFLSWFRFTLIRAFSFLAVLSSTANSISLLSSNSYFSFLFPLPCSWVKLSLFLSSHFIAFVAGCVFQRWSQQNLSSHNLAGLSHSLIINRMLQKWLLRLGQ